MNRGAMRQRLPLVVFLCLLLLPLLVYLSVYSRYSLSARDLLDPIAGDQIMAFLRASLNGEQASLKKDSAINPPGPAWVTIYLDGESAFRQRLERGWGDLNSRLERAGQSIRASAALKELSAEQRRRCRIKVDITVAQGPIFSAIPLFFAKSVIPGLDGLALKVGQQTAYLLPDELFGKQLLAGHQPFFFMGEFRTGLDLQRVVDLLGEKLDVTIEQWRSSQKTYSRFRVQSLISGEGNKALAVKRSRVPVPTQVDRAMVSQAVERATRYVMRQLGPDGKFRYIYYPLDNLHSPPGEYSLPRHAGTTWFLSLAYSNLKDRKILEMARTAINYLTANAVPAACKDTPYACVGTDNSADLGSAALTIVAIVEYQQATGDTRFQELAQSLGRFLLWMQKDNGDFCHQYSPAKGKKNCEDILLYYSGEATLALAKLHKLTRSSRYVEPLERALDFLTGEKYSFFLGQFFISEDHWTCIAAEAAFEAVNKKQYAAFCYAFARLNRRAQIGPDEGLTSDLVGAFNITPFFMPHNTPAGSRTESNVATYLLSLKRGEPQPEIRQTVLRSIRYLVDQQIRPESAYLFPSVGDAVGGMMQTPMRASIRIDYVQHAAAAMSRALAPGVL